MVPSIHLFDVLCFVGMSFELSLDLMTFVMSFICELF